MTRSSSAAGTPPSRNSSAMSLGDCIRQLLLRMKPVHLGAVANDALTQELHATLRDIRGLCQTLGQVRQFQEIQRRGEAERGKQMTRCGDGFAGLITELEGRATEVTARVDRLLRQASTQENEGKEQQVRLATSTTHQQTTTGPAGGKCISDDDDPVEVVVDDAAQSSAVAPVPMDEVVPTTSDDVVEVVMDDATQSSAVAPAPMDEAPPAASDSIVEGDALGLLLLRCGTQPPVLSIEPAAVNNRVEASPTRNAITAFTLKNLRRSKKLCAQEVITADELGELFSHIPKLVSWVDQPNTSRLVVQRGIQTIELATKMVARTKLETGILVRLVGPTRAALLRCRRTELTALAAISSGRCCLCYHLPFQLLEPRTLTTRYRNDVEFARVPRIVRSNSNLVRSCLMFIEKSLYQSWIRPPRQARSTQVTVAPLPLLFLDLSIAVYVTVKLAPLDEALQVVDWMRANRHKYRGEDDLLEIYQSRLTASCTHRSAGDASDSDRVFDFKWEMALISAKLQWYFRLHGDTTATNRSVMR